MLPKLGAQAPDAEANAFDSIEAAVADIRDGKMVIVMDDEDRENEGDLVMAAAKVTPEAINFMRKEGGGLICVPMTTERLDALQIPNMVNDNTAPLGTAFSVSVEARGRVTTGISAQDRSNTIRALIDSASGPADFLRPGHTFPLRAREGGVLVRAGQTEASVDLARLAGQQDDADGVAASGADAADAVPQIDPVVTLCASHGSIMDRKNHPVTLA